MYNKKITALVLVSLASVIWGMSFISKEILLKSFRSGSIISFQFGSVAVILAFFNFFIKKKFEVNKKDFIKLMATGVVGITLYNWFANIGIKETNSSVVSVLLSLIPIACLFVDRILYEKKFTKARILCVFGSVVGVSLVIGIENIKFSGEILGYIYILAAVLSWVVFCYISDNFYKKYSATEILMVQSIGAFISTFYFLISTPVNLDLINSTVIIHMFILVILNACISYCFYVIAIRELGVTVTNMFNNFVPVVTLFINVTFFGYLLSAKSFSGVLIIFVSVMGLNIYDAKVEKNKIAEEERNLKISV